MHPVAPNRGFGLSVEIEPASGCCVGASPGGEKWLGRRDASGRATVGVNVGEEKKRLRCVCDRVVGFHGLLLGAKMGNSAI